MKHSYPDLVSRLGQPLWWDEHGTPRYQPFHPKLCPNIYANQCCLMEVSCQECGQVFKVQLSSGPFHQCPLSEIIPDHRIHYGDPPAAGHDPKCVAGSTMNSDPIRVLEFWTRNKFDWKRQRKFERKVNRE